MSIPASALMKTRNSASSPATRGYGIVQRLRRLGKVCGCLYRDGTRSDAAILNGTKPILKLRVRRSTKLGISQHECLEIKLGKFQR